MLVPWEGKEGNGGVKMLFRRENGDAKLWRVVLSIVIVNFEVDLQKQKKWKLDWERKYL